VVFFALVGDVFPVDPEVVEAGLVEVEAACGVAWAKIGKAHISNSAQIALNPTPRISAGGFLANILFLPSHPREKRFSRDHSYRG
jgi:hypothetical protein